MTECLPNAWLLACLLAYVPACLLALEPQLCLCQALLSSQGLLFNALLSWATPHTCPKPCSSFKKCIRPKVDVIMTYSPYCYWERVSKPKKIGKIWFFVSLWVWKSCFYNFKASVLTWFGLLTLWLYFCRNSDLFRPPTSVSRSKIAIFKKHIFLCFGGFQKQPFLSILGLHRSESHHRHSHSFTKPNQAKNCA